MLWLKIDFHSGEPVYKQIVDGIKNAIISGKLAPDAPLPSIREAARSLNVNPNTVVKAYRELENEKFLYSRPGVGSFVIFNKEHIKDSAINEISQELKSIISSAKNYNLPRQLVSDLMTKTLYEIYGGE